MSRAPDNEQRPLSGALSAGLLQSLELGNEDTGRVDTGTAVVLEAFPGATLVDLDDADLGGHALAYALGGWEVFPLRGKVPLIPKRDGGRGVLDATSDLATIGRWWDRWPTSNIGIRVPRALVVLDIDPRHGGEHLTYFEMTDARMLPTTLTSISGRGDGGRHLWWLHPGGKLSAARLPDGIDVKTHAGYVVAPPSIHPATGNPYRWACKTLPPAEMPPWLADWLRPPAPPRHHRVTRSHRCTAPSIADAFTAATTWAQVLQPHGWVEVAPDQWRHPAATNPVSATVTNDCLFVYSTGTPFEPTEPGDPHGYTRFRAWGVLNYGGDLSAAARALRGAR